MDNTVSTAVNPSACHLPGCDGLFHFEGTCSAELAEMPLGDGDLTVELVSPADGPAYLTLFAFGVFMGENQITATDPAAARAAADRFRAFAAALDRGAALLTSPSLSITPRAAAREQVSR